MILSWNSGSDFSYNSDYVSWGGYTSKLYLAHHPDSTGQRTSTAWGKWDSDLGAYETDVSAYVHFKGINDELMFSFSEYDTEHDSIGSRKSSSYTYSSGQRIRFDTYADAEGELGPYESVHTWAGLVEFGTNRSSAIVESREDFDYNNDQTKTFNPRMTSASATGVQKTVGTVPHIPETVTIDAFESGMGDKNGTQNGAFTVTVDNHQGGSQSVSTPGTHSLNLEATNDVSLDISMSSDGNQTPGIKSVKVDAAPAVRVYRNGQWKYEPIKYATDYGVDTATELSVYDGTSFQ